MKKIRELNDDWLNQHRNHCLTRWRHTEFKEGKLAGVLTEKCECVTCGGERAQRVIAEGIERKVEVSPPKEKRRRRGRRIYRDYCSDVMKEWEL